MAYDATKNQYHPAADITDVTDNSGGTASDTLAVIADGPTADALASLAAKVNDILAALRADGAIGGS